MWAKLFQSLAKYLLIPLIQELGLSIVKYVREWLESRKKDEQAKQDAEEYREAKPGSDSDEFRNLP